LLTPPYPQMSEQLRQDWEQTRIETESHGVARGPWIEIVGRAVPAPKVF
jgi:hypothetical protein